MVYKIALQFVLGQTLQVWFGLITFVSLLVTANLGLIYRKRFLKFKFKWHWLMAGVTITLALIHMFLGLSILFSF